jgi:NADPH2:quinone reductase
MMRKAEVGAGDRVFVPGATGGVGVACVQLSEVVGATSVGTSTSAAKLDRLAALGCDHTVETADPDEMVEAVGEVGEMDATLNHLAGEYVEVGLKVLKRGGKQVVCGRTAGRESTFNAAPFFLGHREVIGSTMGTQPELETLVSLVAGGKLDPVVGGSYSIEETDEAFRSMADRSVFGKLVVEP